MSLRNKKQGPLPQLSPVGRVGESNREQSRYRAPARPYIIGKGNQTAIGTLVERNTNYTMLVHLPHYYKAEQMRDTLTAKIKTLPESLRHSLTWDQCIEMQDWKTVKMDTSIEIYFCDPH
ncbi:transposase [Paeniglutamicibacter sp. MACA_103]|uniref:transposase n=1 Tax=Paeniglutamicibacter sp. MACA_103 TaxID=3377337 RepID=UPI003895EF80